MLRALFPICVLGTTLFQLSACCGSSGGKSCSSTIRYKGETYEAASTAPDSQSDATRLACRRYCKTDDPEVETAWRAWKASPEGATSTRERDAELEVRSGLFSAVNRCQGTCVAEMVLTPTLATVTCAK